MGRLGFRAGVSASYSYFRRVRNFDFVYTADVSVPLGGTEPLRTTRPRRQLVNVIFRPYRRIISCPCAIFHPRDVVSHVIVVESSDTTIVQLRLLVIQRLRRKGG